MNIKLYLRYLRRLPERSLHCYGPGPTTNAWR